MTVANNNMHIVRRLEAEGRFLVSTKGSHGKIRKGRQALKVRQTKKDLPFGTAHNIALTGSRPNETA